MTGMSAFSGWGMPGFGRPAHRDRLARRVFLNALSRFRLGRLNLVEGHKRLTVGRRTDDCSIEATIFVKTPRFYRYVIVAGSVGAAESFALGHWSADNLTDALRIVLLNRMVFEQTHRKWRRYSALAHSLLHVTRQAIDVSKRYDTPSQGELDDEFYPLFLDVGCGRSCGIFSQPDTTLAEAVSAAYERLCRKLRLRADDEVLEIGSSWGGFAIHAASRYDCRIVAAVEFERQIQPARQRVQAAGVADRVRIVPKNVRQPSGRFDKLVSIETIESMDRRYRDIFFQDCSRLLKENGMMALQAVTKSDHVCDRRPHNVDFAGPFIHPGGCLPSLTAISQSTDRNTDLRTVHLEDITPHHALTMRRWREGFYANVNRARARGISENVLRRWAFCLCYGEAGFVERYFGSVQMIFAKSLSRHNPILPPLASKFGVILQRKKDEIANWLS
jgi:cyclopropane-fatty-acyl-phospholipid synthase